MASNDKRLTPARRLMLAMDRCAVARGEAQWTNGYAAAFDGTEEGTRLREKEQAQWQKVEQAETAFFWLAQRLTRGTR